MGALDVLARLWADAGGDAAALEHVAVSDVDEARLAGPFCVATAATASIGAAALAAGEAWAARTGRRQQVTLETRAAVAAFRGERYLHVDGRRPADPWGPISGFYSTADGRFVQLHCNFPHHEAGVLAVLGCGRSREATAAAVAGWKGSELDDALARAGLCAALVRTPQEWAAHPQGVAVAPLPLLEIVRIGEAPAEPVGAGNRPLFGVRALDLTRVIAGPVCGRTLAEHGADVLLVTAPHLPAIDVLVIDTGHGKRSASLDLRRAADREQLQRLVAGTDVVCQAYRPGALASRGFGPEDAARMRPGIVYVTLSAYSHAGPWHERRGFDSLLQSASGIAYENGVAMGGARPRHLPAQALDYATGYLAAFGATMALVRRAREGGSWLVRVSLAQTGRWLDRLGRQPDHAAVEQTPGDVSDYMMTTDTAFGRLWHVGPVARLAETPARWTRPAAPLGSDPPCWPAG